MRLYIFIINIFLLKNLKDVASLELINWGVLTEKIWGYLYTGGVILRFSVQELHFVVAETIIKN